MLYRQKWKLYPLVDFCPQTVIMATHCPARAALMLVGFLTFLVAFTLNTLAGYGANSGEYLSGESKDIFGKVFVE